STMIGDGNVTMSKINQAGATTGQVLKWTGSAWAPRNDSIGNGLFLPLSGGTMTGPITSTGDPEIKMGKGNFGSNNRNPGTQAFVAGSNNSALGAYSVVSGGGGPNESDSNAAVGNYSTIGGGSKNIGSGNYATISGGGGNIASDTGATVGGGIFNRARGRYAVVAGGGGPNLADSNAANGNWAVVSGGNRNRASGSYATVGGGSFNSASAWYATIGGGTINYAISERATIGGGGDNHANAPYATISGGLNNWASGDRTTIGGGESNHANGEFSTIGGGLLNEITNNYSTVSGGTYNTASGVSSTVGGGYANSASGYYSMVAGGREDTSAAHYSFTTNYASKVPSGYSSSAAFNGQTASASSQLRCGALVGNSKSFQIDHPLDPNGKFLNHFSVESPKLLVTYDGVAVIGNDGRIVVNLPDYFSALTKEPRIQLTGVGSPDIVYVAEDISNNQFVIGGKPGMKVYWQVTAERKDVSAEITKILMPVEQEKTGELRGVSADDNYLMTTLDQLQEMGYGNKFNFRTERGRQRYDNMKRMEREAEIRH
ncbi:MAG: hypothetical protein ABIK31_00690, partial [candidate division WOR-3 bacterium]